MGTKKRKTVLVSGCFDLMHFGHVQFLQDAAALGDRLVVCVAGEAPLAQHKGRFPAIPTEHKAAILKEFECVDDVVIATKAVKKGMDFVPYLNSIRPDILAVTTDDQYIQEKRILCKSRGIEYVSLPKRLDFEQISTTEIRKRCAAPVWVPLRVDFAGGWFDVPKLAEDGQYIINCTITPGLSLEDNWAHPGAGLGGSAAWAMLRGDDPVEFELACGVGWQDPACLVETGLCVWKSGYKPSLDFKQSAEWLDGLMAIKKIPGHHKTVDLVNKPRNYNLIRTAGTVGRNAVRHKSIHELSQAIQLTARMHFEEGMDQLPHFGEMAAKYCGSGYGGYALYLFPKRQERDEFVVQHDGIAIEPYDRWGF